MKSLNEILKMEGPSRYLYDYAWHRGRLEPKWERLLLSLEEPRYAYYYAKYVIKGKWSEAEGIIIKDPHYAYYYARYVIKDRWPEAEPYIIKDPRYAYYYAKYVIKGRWPEAEEYITKDIDYLREYVQIIESGQERINWYKDLIDDISISRLKEIADNIFIYVKKDAGFQLKCYHKIKDIKELKKILKVPIKQEIIKKERKCS